MSLRNILYVDSNALNNYVSQIDGYTYEEAFKRTIYFSIIYVL